TALEQMEGQPADSGRFTGMGAWGGYAVHTLAMSLRMMGSAIRSVIDTGTAGERTVTLDYGDERRALIDVREAENGFDALGWTFAARIGQNYIAEKITDYDGFYLNLMRRAASFVKTGKADMPVEEA